MSLRDFWSYTLKDGEELMLSQPTNWDCVITEVCLVDPSEIKARATLTASVETLLIDKPQINGDFQSIEYSAVLATFCKGESAMAKLVNAAFTGSDICYVQANGAALTVSGYIMPSQKARTA